MNALRLCAAALTLASLLAGAVAAQAADIASVLQGLRWGESSAGLAAHFGARATVLPQPIDFGDSYAQIVLRDVAVGGVPLIAFFQMDKSTHGLKRVQLERQRHGVTPPAFRAVLAGLEADYGTPDLSCGIRPLPASGYQAAAERIWRRGGLVVRAIFRDTTLEAFEGCWWGIGGPCGLTGQLLVRLSPPEAETAGCPATPRP